ncbi:hypothetical protein, partial [Ralstonia pseudosolanacearum]|uniref:hypothetical protein n=1 Tax=Ralstonia pseudosolanacearum TaxID=1310165 RepID=UPI003CF18438
MSPKAGFKENKKASLKKKLKLVKGVSKDLLRFSSMGFGEDGLMGEVKGMKISEATQILLSQLKQLKAEEKDLKRKRKQEKAKLKAAGGSSSSSSSESSDGETREVLTTAAPKPID